MPNGDGSVSVQVAIRKAAERLAPERAFIAASDVGIALRFLPGTGTAESIWFAVVQEAAKLDKLGALVSWLQQDYPNDEALQRIQGVIVAGGAVVAADALTPANPEPHDLSAAVARRIVIAASFGLCTITVLFFLLAPALGYPLRYRDLPRFLEVIAPTLFGYLSSATLYFISGRETTSDLRYPTLLVVAPFVVVSLGLIVSLFAFGWTNRLAAPAGGGMDRNDLSLALVACMALLSVTTTVLANHLFARERRAS